MNTKIRHIKELAKNEKGLTLIEILAVVTIIVLVYMVIGGGIFKQAGAAQAQLNRTQAEKIKDALNMYKLSVGKYPNNLMDLVKASDSSDGNSSMYVPTLEERQIKDVYGNPFQYKAEGDGRSYSLTSLGADGSPGGDGKNADLTVKP